MRQGKDFKPNMSIVQACLDIIDYMKPDYWVLENVQGSQGFFLPLIGGRRQKIGPFYLWGNFPLLAMPPRWEHNKYDGDAHSSNPLRANLRAMIPFELSFELHQTISRQWTLRRWE